MAKWRLKTNDGGRLFLPPPSLPEKRYFWMQPCSRSWQGETMRIFFKAEGIQTYFLCVEVGESLVILSKVKFRCCENFKNRDKKEIQKGLLS